MMPHYSETIQDRIPLDIFQGNPTEVFHLRTFPSKTFTSLSITGNKYSRESAFYWLFK